MGSTRIRGNKLPSLKLGTPGTEFAADLTTWEISNDDADSDVTTFEDAADGSGRQEKLTGTAIQSTAAASFWRYVWENRGLKNVPFTVAPHGNAVPTVAEPHFVGFLAIGARPTIGMEANTSATSASTFEFEFLIEGEVTMDEGA